MTDFDVEVLWAVCKRQKAAPPKGGVGRGSKHSEAKGKWRRRSPKEPNKSWGPSQYMLLPNVRRAVEERTGLVWEKNHFRGKLRDMEARGWVRLEAANPAKAGVKGADLYVLPTGVAQQLMVRLFPMEVLRAGTLTGYRGFMASVERMASLVEEARPMAWPRSGKAEDVLARVAREVEVLGEDEREERKRVRVLREEAEKDPVAWVEAVGWKVMHKERGLVAFEPWGWQKDLMRRMVRPGERVVVPKSRQVGVTTTLITACSWALLHRDPWRCHIVSNKEETARERCLSIARTGFQHASLPEEVWRGLSLGGEKTNLVEYRQGDVQNYMRAHAASGDAARSFDGNVVLLDEVAYMQYGSDVYTGIMGMLDLAQTSLWLVSTYAGDGDFFCKCVDEAEGMGLDVIPFDWRAHPERDEAWREAMIPKFPSIADFEREHELKRVGKEEAAIDAGALLRFQRGVEYVGRRPLPGHLYVKGVDVAAVNVAKTCFCAVDVTVRPAQVACLEIFLPRDTPEGKTRLQQQVEAIEAFDRAWPGPLFIDGTNEKGLAAQVKAERKIAVHFTGGNAVERSWKFDKIDKLLWLRLPRPTLIDNLALLVNSGKVVVHERQFPELVMGLRSLRKGVSQREKGKFGDMVDALMLAGQGMMGLKVRAGVEQGRRAPQARSVKNEGPLAGLRPGRRFERGKVW
ncbi:MAG: hypothetical protein PHZ19_08270 [Candidatus Thermoplasmatota archaeon]|nr:hypothetical protein [Candidatus Thermoplasmatota archaeon]